MFGNIPESDWRQFKRVHEVLLERFCRRVLDDLAELVRGEDGSAYDRYQRLYRLIRERDKELGQAFNDFRRSTAIMQLVLMRRMRLLTDEELSGFSEQTQNRVRAVDSICGDETDSTAKDGPARRG